MWELCNSEHSHISQVCVPLLLHCITLPVGSDMFWKILQEVFLHSDWRVRFQAVERVTVIARFMDSTPLRTEVNLQAALATAFCHLIKSMDDINVYVAQRSTLYLGTIHDTAIRVSWITTMSNDNLKFNFPSSRCCIAWNPSLTCSLLTAPLSYNLSTNFSTPFPTEKS